MISMFAGAVASGYEQVAEIEGGDIGLRRGTYSAARRESVRVGLVKKIPAITKTHSKTTRRPRRAPRVLLI
jgi:hypothetical protein